MQKSRFSHGQLLKTTIKVSISHIIVYSVNISFSLCKMVLIIGYHMFDMLTRVTFSDVMNPAMRFLEI